MLTLDLPVCQQAVPLAVRLRLADLRLFETLDSTNTYLLHAANAGAPSGVAALALTQTAGRGRQAKVWASLTGNLHLSLLWRYPQTPEAVTALSLVVGVALAELLAEFGVECRLKWPNDLLVGGRKLGGILLETRMQGGALALVVGVGINRVTSGLATATDLHSLGCKLSLEVLAGRVLGTLLQVCGDYPALGFAPWRDRWQALDAYAGLEVVVTTPHTSCTGTARGVSETGALCLDSADGRISLHSGEVNLRRVP